MRNPDLWARLEAFEFDKGRGTAPFSVKLALGEGWSVAFTARVIEEYRRFLYLTQVSDRQVTPSQIVDAAWHMHLTFTRDYWEDLCPNVIGKAVHHQPCAGEEEMPRYRNQYAATKALYEAEFGMEPPADIWARNQGLGLRRFVNEETGSFTGSPTFIAFVPFAISLGLFIFEPDWLIGIIALFTGVMFFVVLLNPRRRKKTRKRQGPGDDVWIDDDSGSGRGSARGGRSTPDKESRDDDNKPNSGAGVFLGLFGGGGDGDSDDGGGGCGGCGGGD